MAKRSAPGQMADLVKDRPLIAKYLGVGYASAGLTPTKE